MSYVKKKYIFNLIKIYIISIMNGYFLVITMSTKNRKTISKTLIQITITGFIHAPKQSQYRCYKKMVSNSRNADFYNLAKGQYE